jgi:hypothetical protein
MPGEGRSPNGPARTIAADPEAGGRTANSGDDESSRERLLSVGGQGLRGDEVNVADDATVVGALRLLQVMEEYMAECGTTMADIAQAVGAIAAVVIELGEQPDGEPVGSVEFDEGRGINGDPGTNGVEDGADVGEELVLLFVGDEFHRSVPSVGGPQRSGHGKLADRWGPPGTERGSSSGRNRLESWVAPDVPAALRWRDRCLERHTGDSPSR